MDHLVYSVADAAKLLRLSKTTVYQLAREGRIPCIRFYKRIMIPRKKLEEMVENIGTDRLGSDSESEG